MPKNLGDLERQIGYRFNDQKILKEAMTHGSSRVDNVSLRHHERLEFLGDAVLQTVISSYLFKASITAAPGELTMDRQQLVSDNKQNQIAFEISIQDYVETHSSMQRSNFRRYGEFIEALIGAVFVDAGYNGIGLEKAQEVIYKLWKIQPPNNSNCTVM